MAKSKRIQKSKSPSSAKRGPRHSGDLVGQRDGGDLRRPPRQQRREPRSMPGTVDLGIADHGERASREQAAQIAIALFADTTELSLPPLEQIRAR